MRIVLIALLITLIVGLGVIARDLLGDKPYLTEPVKVNRITL